VNEIIFRGVSFSSCWIAQQAVGFPSEITKINLIRHVLVNMHDYFFPERKIYVRNILTELHLNSFFPNLLIQVISTIAYKKFGYLEDRTVKVYFILNLIEILKPYQFIESRLKRSTTQNKIIKFSKLIFLTSLFKLIQPIVGFSNRTFKILAAKNIAFSLFSLNYSNVLACMAVITLDLVPLYPGVIQEPLVRQFFKYQTYHQISRFFCSMIAKYASSLVRSKH
jgi:hypothetical protein